LPDGYLETNDYPTAKVEARLTLYGVSWFGYSEIGTISFGFSYSEFTFTPKYPVITYKLRD
jgi:hypothetical protein